MSNTTSELQVIIKIDDLEPPTGKIASFIILPYDVWLARLSMIEKYFELNDELYVTALDDSPYFAADKDDLMSDLIVEFLQPEEVEIFKKHFPHGKVGVLSNLLDEENFVY